MPTRIRTIALCAATCAASLAANAQALLPAAQHGAVAYQSAFDCYRPFSADAVGDWRQANDTVREIGGWRAYARAMQGPAAAPTPPCAGAARPPAPLAPSAPALPANPHQGHHR